MYVHEIEKCKIFCQRDLSRIYTWGEGRPETTKQSNFNANNFN